MYDWRYFHRFRKRWFDRKVEECELEAQRLREELQALEDELAESQRRFEAAIAAICEEEAAARREFEAAEAEACREDSWIDYDEEQDADALEYAKTYGPEVNQRLWKHGVAANKDQIADAYLYATIVRDTRSIDVVFEILRDHPKLKATVSIDTSRGQALAAIALGREHLYPKGKCLSKSKKRTLRRAVATWGRHTRSGGFSVGAETTSPADEARAHPSPVDSASSTAEPSTIAAPASSKRSAACLLCEGLVTLIVVASSWLVYALARRLRKEGVGTSKTTPAPDEASSSAKTPSSETVDSKPDDAPSFAALPSSEASVPKPNEAPSIAEAPSSEASALNNLDVESVDLEIKRPTGEIHRLSFRPTDRVEVVLCALADEIGCDARILRLLEDGERIPEDTPVQSIEVELDEPLILVFEQRGGGPGASTASAESSSPASSNPPTAGEVTLNDLPSKDSLVVQLGGDEPQVWKDYCLTRPPEDLKSGRYNAQSVRLAELYQPVVDLVSSLNDICGNRLVACYLCLPYRLAVLASIQGMAALNYCPKELESALQGEHSALARRSSGRLMSNTFEFVRLSCSSLFGLFAKIDMIPFEVDYGVEPSEFVPKEVYRKIMAAMRTFFLAAVSEKILPLTMLLSKKTVKVFQEDILQMNDAEFAEFLKQDGANVLQSAGGKPHPFSHPERLLKYFTNSHKAECEEWDAGFDALFDLLDASDRCTTAIALHDNTKDHPAVRLMKERHAEACKFGGKQSHRQLVFADVMAGVGFDSRALSPDWKREFGYWDLKFASQGRRGKLIEVLKSKLRGWDKLTVVRDLAAAFQRKAKEMKLGAADDVISDKVLAALSPDWTAKYVRLLELYDDKKADLFRALKAKLDGGKKGALALKVMAAEDKNSEFMLKLRCRKPACKCGNQATTWIGDKIDGAENLTNGQCVNGPRIYNKDCSGAKGHSCWELTEDSVALAEFKAKHGLLEEEGSKIAARKTSKRKAVGGGLATKVKAADDKGSTHMLEVKCRKPGCKCGNEATTWIGNKVDRAENLTNGHCMNGPRITGKDCGCQHQKWSLTGEDMKLDEFKTKHGLQETEEKAVRKSSKRKAVGSSDAPTAQPSTSDVSSDDEGVAAADISTSDDTARPKGSLEDIASLGLEHTEYTTVPAVKTFQCAARSLRLMTVPGYGMRVEVMFDGLFYEGTIICVTEETSSSFELTVWFDDSECRNVSYPASDVRLIKGLAGDIVLDVAYPASDVRLIKGLAGDIVLDVAHLAFLKNPRYLEITQEAAENGIRLAPSGMRVGASLDEKKLDESLT